MALDVFLSIPNIPGESEDVNFKGTIVTPTYEWGLANDALGGRSGKATFAPLSVTKTVDKASPLLMRALVQGTPIAAMTLLLERAGASAGTPPFLVYQFSTVRVTSVDDSGSGGLDTPFESVTFIFGAYELRYRATLPDGALSPTVVTSEWSVLTNSVPKVPVLR